MFCASAEDWAQWRGTQRNGISSEQISTTWTTEGPKVLWRTNVGTGFSSIAVSKGRAYTMGNSSEKDTIWCLDATTGKELWRYTYDAQLGPQYYEGGPGATPTVHNGQVFTISKWGDVFCLNAKDGKVIWQRDLRKNHIQPNRWGFAGSPLICRDLVILNAGAAGTALDRRTGKIVWSNGTNATGYASPVLVKAGEKEAILVFAAKHLVLVEARSGKELWRYPWETGWDTNNPDPIPYNDVVFISSFSRGCALLRIATGELVYENKSLHNHLSPPVLLGKYLYAFNGEAKRDTDFRCIDLLSGDVKWQVSDPPFGSLIAAGGKLLLLSEKGELLLGEASPTGFSPKARAQVIGGLCWTPPGIADGRIYIRNAVGDLVCLKTD
jgi:outer membrane protein assembly factor BamB